MVFAGWKKRRAFKADLKKHNDEIKDYYEKMIMPPSYGRLTTQPMQADITSSDDSSRDNGTTVRGWPGLELSLAHDERSSSRHVRNSSSAIG